MPATRVSEQKRKQTAEVAEPLASSGGQSKSKARRVSTDALTSNAAFQQTNDAASVANNASDKNEESIQSIGKMIQDLCCSDNAKVSAALDALNLDVMKDKKKLEIFVTAGGCLALVNYWRSALTRRLTEFWLLIKSPSGTNSPS